MKFAVLAASIATLAPLASAAGYQAAWTIVGDKCDGQISLGEYTATPATCTPKDCGAIPGETKFSTKTTCAETHTDAAKTVLGANNKPYVLVEVYKADSNCTGAFDIAIGVTADDVCYPGTNGKASYKVSWTLEKGTVWLQYPEAGCKGEETKVEFAPSAADGKFCTAGKLKALAVAPSADSAEAGNAGSNSSDSTVTMAPGATTMMPASTTAAPAANSSASNSSAATPAPTKSAAATSFVSAAAIATFAVAAAALA